MYTINYVSLLRISAETHHSKLKGIYYTRILMVPEVYKKRVKNDILEDQGNNGFQGIDERAINEGT